MYTILNYKQNKTKDVICDFLKIISYSNVDPNGVVYIKVIFMKGIMKLKYKAGV